MNYIEERIRKEGCVKSGDVLKVDAFLNHQIDMELVDACAAEFVRRFEGTPITRVLTIETSGIILAGAAKEKPQVAEVVAVGPGGNVEGKDITMYVNVGDKVLISRYSGTEVKLDGMEYTIVKQNDILAVVTD